MKTIKVRLTFLEPLLGTWPANPNVAREYIAVLDRQSHRLKKLTEDLVEASKASSGVLNVDLQPTDVNVLFSQIEGEYQESDYLPVSSKDIKIMYQELTALVQSFQNPYLKKLASSYFLEDKAFVKKFCFHSAAKSVHHGFVGGLLEHTLSVMKLCDFYTKSYPALNRDLLLTAALFHDIGKVQELSAFPENDYTDDGQLLGHIVIGTMMVADRIKEIPGFPAKTAAELKHCILAHHGELEYGSPKKPALLEALALNFADNTDAKMETMLEVLKSGGENPGWLGYNRFLETNVRKTTPTE